jgi:hypothetical protein
LILVTAASRGIEQALVEEAFSWKEHHVGRSHNSSFPVKARGRIRQCLPGRDRVGGRRRMKEYEPSDELQLLIELSIEPIAAKLGLLTPSA